MYARTDSVFADNTYRQLKDSSIKLKDNAQFCVDIPFLPQLRFQRTSIGWRKNIKAKGSKSSYSKSDFPTKQSQYIQEELYWQLQRESKNICQTININYESQYRSALCCENSKFWIIVIIFLSIFGGIGLFVYGRGNDINLDFAAGLMVFGGCGALLLLLLIKKWQNNKKEKLLNQMLLEFEEKINKLDVMDPNNNEWATKLLIVVKVKIDENKHDNKSYKLALFRSLDSGTITITS